MPPLAIAPEADVQGNRGLGDGVGVLGCPGVRGNEVGALLGQRTVASSLVLTSLAACRLKVWRSAVATLETDGILFSLARALGTGAIAALRDLAATTISGSC